MNGAGFGMMMPADFARFAQDQQRQGEEGKSPTPEEMAAQQRAYFAMMMAPYGYAMTPEQMQAQQQQFLAAQAAASGKSKTGNGEDGSATADV